MAESFDPSQIEAYKAGERIHFDYIKPLHDFESALVQEILPPRRPDRLHFWQDRIPFLEAIKPLGSPQSFRGSITDVVIQSLENPYEELAANGPRVRVTGEHSEWYEDHTLGFGLAAQLYAPNKRIVGILGTRVWEVQRPLHNNLSGSDRVEYRRIVEKPQPTLRSCSERLKEARKLGHEVIDILERVRADSAASVIRPQTLNRQ